MNNENEPQAICDCCSAAIEYDDVHTGEAGTEWEGCGLCPACYDEEGTAQ